jgi:RNA recognition motif-containing protein
LDVRAPHTGEEERHGLVTYENQTAAEKAIQRLNGKPLLGCPIKVKHFTHRRNNDTSPPVSERRRAGLALEKKRA